MDANETIGWFLCQSIERQKAFQLIINQAMDDEEYRISLRHLMIGYLLEHPVPKKKIPKKKLLD